MSYNGRRLPTSSAVDWLRANPTVGEGVRTRTAFPGKAIPDALLEDPTRVVDVLKAALVEAITTDAPVGVVEDLLISLRLSATGAQRFDRSGATAKALSALQGLRDRGELVAALETNAANASDEGLGGEFTRLRGIVDAMPASDELFTLGPDDHSPDTTIVVDPGGPGPDPGPGPVTDPGTDIGTSRTGPDPGTDVTVAPDASGGRFDPGGALGAVIGSYLAGADGAAQGAAIGTQLTSGGGGFDSVTVGAQIGELLAGPEGKALGAQIGAKLTSSIESTVDHLIDLAAAAACVLCGPICIICVLAAEAIGDVVHNVIHEALQ